MERYFALPIALSAAAHAALLFGFTKSPRVEIPPAPDLRPMNVVFTLPPEPPEPVLVETAGEKPSAPPEAPRPSGADESIPNADVTFTMPRQPAVPVHLPGIAKIPPVAPGPVGTSGIEGGGGNIFNIDLLDNPPRTRLQSAPMYPFEAKRQGIRGEVLVEFTVDESGRVINPRIVESSHAMFEEPTLRAVGKWRFEPGRRHGRVVSFRMAVPVVFNLAE